MTNEQIYGFATLGGMIWAALIFIGFRIGDVASALTTRDMLESIRQTRKELDEKYPRSVR